MFSDLEGSAILVITLGFLLKGKISTHLTMCTPGNNFQVWTLNDGFIYISE